MPKGHSPVNPSDQNGIYLTGGSSGNMIRNNIIANHPGVGILANANAGYLAEPPHNFPSPVVCEPYFNTFSQNRIFGNAGPGIDLRSGDCLGATVFPNQDIQPPQITSANTALVTGTTCPSCTVEIFIADKNAVPDPSGEDQGEGKTFVGQVAADGAGNFSVAVSGLAQGHVVTSTATDASGNTSEFSGNVVVSAGQPGGGNNRLFLPVIEQGG
jgi:hypothetical protein